MTETKKFYSNATMDENILIHVFTAKARDGHPLVEMMNPSPTGKKRARISGAIQNRPQIARKIEQMYGLSEGAIQPYDRDRFYISYTVWENNAEYLARALHDGDVLVMHGKPTVYQAPTGKIYVNVSVAAPYVVRHGSSTRPAVNSSTSSTGTAPAAAPVQGTPVTPAPVAASQPVQNAGVPNGNEDAVAQDVFSDFPMYY